MSLPAEHEGVRGWSRETQECSGHYGDLDGGLSGKQSGGEGGDVFGGSNLVGAQFPHWCGGGMSHTHM